MAPYETLNPDQYDGWLKITPDHNNSKAICVRSTPLTGADVDEVINTAFGFFALELLGQGDCPETARTKAEVLLVALQQFISTNGEVNNGPDQAGSWSIYHQGIGEITAHFPGVDYMGIPKQLEQMYASQGATFQYINGEGQMILAIGNKWFLLDYQTGESTLVIEYVPEEIRNEFIDTHLRLQREKYRSLNSN